MKVKEVMTRDPACCTRETRLSHVARMMVEQDCGAIPVVYSDDEKRLVGMVTDRDIVCRAVAEDKNPLDLVAADCMSEPVVTVTENSSVEECCKQMEEKQIRRVPVVDNAGVCCGIVAQADIAVKAPDTETAELVKEISQRSEAPSRIS